MGLKFGTSGLRGLVVEMTPEAVAAYTGAFLAACDTGTALCVGRDLRDSSPRIMDNVIAAARQAGTQVIDCGALPTPALAFAARQRDAGAVMVTGSHIPADRNGLKFYTSDGEITKADEAAILAIVAGEGSAGTGADIADAPLRDAAAADRFRERYVAAYGAGALAGQRLGLYAHSAVGRDLLARCLSELGAEVIEVGRSERFVPVDTEAVDSDTRARIKAWVARHGLSALVSTDGDSDRPLLADETGEIVPGDLLGQITAEALQAGTVVTPVTSNSGVARKGFAQVLRTRVGSPFVIAAMQAAGGDVVGYEANGGFLLGFAARGPAGPLAPLMTRDCLLPLIATLHAARQGTVSARVRREPPVTTLSDRLQEIPTQTSQALVARLTQDAAARAAFLAPLGFREQSLDLTDGLRMTLADGSVVHIRPSGNAPELRLYIEAEGREAAGSRMTAARAALTRALAAL